MKVSREVLIGLVAILTIVGSIWGYKFLKGENIFSSTKTYYIEYDHIDQLGKSDPVLINGYQIGSVLDIKLNDQNNRTLIVTISIIGEINVPQGSQATITSTSIMGGKAIVLKLNGICHDDDCLPSGSMLEGKSVGFLESMLDAEDIENYMTSFNRKIRQFIDTLDSSLHDSEMRDGIGKAVRDIQVTIHNLREVSSHVNELAISLKNTTPDLLNNVNDVVKNFKTQEATIDTILYNIKLLTGDLRQSDIPHLAQQVDTVLIQSASTIQGLAEATQELKEILAQVNTGEGSLGKLIQDESLYHNLDRSMRNLDLLLQDLRLNPKRYVHFSVFGKKGKEYSTMDEDSTAIDKQ